MTNRQRVLKVEKRTAADTREQKTKKLGRRQAQTMREHLVVMRQCPTALAQAEARGLKFSEARLPRLR